MKNTKDKAKLELIVFGCYLTGIILVALTKIPAFILTTGFSVPISIKMIK